MGNNGMVWSVHKRYKLLLEAPGEPATNPQSRQLYLPTALFDRWHRQRKPPRQVRCSITVASNVVKANDDGDPEPLLVICIAPPAAGAKAPAKAPPTSAPVRIPHSSLQRVMSDA